MRLALNTKLHALNLVSNNFNNNDFCSFKKHLLTSYFEKYECLVDSNFQDFITNELHSRMCEVLPDDLRLVIRPSVLQRHLIGEGSHHHLSSSATTPRLTQMKAAIQQGDPDLFMHCYLEGKSHNQSCLYIPTSNGAESKICAAVWRIPSGIKGHGGVVSVVTFFSALLLSLLIVLTSIFFSDVKPCKSSNQS
ncbi:hypothetical protein JRO89_XS02G0235500 [Xanthoceras sorbifolium]|uniref:Uncharacterized protein n=1 Tax=Xanthoceras sorbifolium TaxID=99658 RepID=A0ABQ8IGQ4_9ROSI|nr:hypothetical protein JRO89_XS02G0235500 [Xanthoceras sorbifolium]